MIGSALGTLVSVSGLELPPIVFEPALLIANACVPVLLISYGISLHGQRVLGPSGRRRDIVLATTLKLTVMPLVAWSVAAFVFGLSAARGADRRRAGRSAHRPERLQLLPALRRRRDDLARHGLPDDDRLRAGAAAGDVPPRLSARTSTPVSPYFTVDTLQRATAPPRKTGGLCYDRQPPR